MVYPLWAFIVVISCKDAVNGEIRNGYQNTDAQIHRWSRVSTELRNNTDTDLVRNRKDRVKSTCEFKVDNGSARQWRGRVSSSKPDFVHFTLKIDHPYTTQSNVMKPLQWMWTYACTCSAQTDNYSVDSSFRNWPIDYGILSFGLLNAKTIDVGNVNLDITSDENCTIAFGHEDTTHNVVDALMVLMNGTNLEHEKYKFCFYHYQSLDNTSFAYMAAVYLRFPLSDATIHYKCCEILYNYETESYYVSSCGHETNVWWLSVFGPYIMGLLIFLFFPIPHFKIMAWLAKEHKLDMENYLPMESTHENRNGTGGSRIGAEWLYLDGNPPLTFLDTFGLITSGIRQKYPILVSRLVRLAVLILIPLTMGIQLWMYSDGFDKHISIDDLMQIGEISSFLALLGNTKDMAERFVPLFGGPVGILVLYGILGTLLVLLPNSLKQVVEYAMPSSRPISPLFLNVEDISKFASIPILAKPGYAKAAALWKCSVYMLFSRDFWVNLFKTQSGRYHRIYLSDMCSFCKIILYAVLSCAGLVEIILCIILYGFPICGCLLITMKGAVVSIGKMRIRNRKIRGFVRSPYIVAIMSFVILCMAFLFAYALALIFLQDFMFFSQVVLFCFIAIFTYPSVSFGYLFFFVVLVFYVVRLVREFGECYLELLNTAVEITLDIDGRANNVIVQGSSMYVTNCRAANVNTIYVNGTLLEVTQASLQSIGNAATLKKIGKEDNAYGIPKDLFECLVKRHKPIHVQILQLVVRLVFIVCFLSVVLNVTSRTVTGPTSEISDVMHVIFTVVLGALPRMIETAFINESKSVKREIETRNIEQTIQEYWREKEERQTVV